VANVAFFGTEVAAFLGVPAAITIAILKYRLYDIDVIINRAVVYGLLAAAFTGVYVLVVVGIGSLIGYGVGDPLLTTIAVVAIALLFQPLRRRAQRLANRLVYGDRATPYQVLSEFADKMAGTYGLDDVLQRMASILAQGTGATRVDVWLRVGGELRPVATRPADATERGPIALAGDDQLPTFDDTRAVAVRHARRAVRRAHAGEAAERTAHTHGGQALTGPRVAGGTGPAERPTHRRAQANVDDLRASRRRLVEAQDENGARSSATSTTARSSSSWRSRCSSACSSGWPTTPSGCGRWRRSSGRTPRRAGRPPRPRARDHPPLLADKGLAVALEAQGRKAAVPTTVEPDGVGRYPREVEAAVYFCALEAMQNIAKYADARSATVRLAERDGRLVFEIEDDGLGFDADATTYGTGVQGMADRLDAIGGTLDIRSAPGEGTVVRGEVIVVDDRT
jgi:hypothetical protein